MTNCKECGKPLKLIGTARTNGKTSHGDWATREYHKSCWKKLENKKNSYNYFRRQNITKDSLSKSEMISCSWNKTKNI